MVRIQYKYLAVCATHFLAITLFLVWGILTQAQSAPDIAKDPTADSSSQTQAIGQPSNQPQKALAATGPVAATGAGFVQGNFFTRLTQAYLNDWKGTAASEGEPKRRGFPAPVDGPPYPFADWPYGGSVVIGAPWTQSSPLMQALWSGPHGEEWKNSKVQIYGWFNGGFNISSSNKPGYANLPAAYPERPNSFQPDQQVLYIERQPDTVQTDHFDWGFRIAQLWGLDYRFTAAKGIFSHQLLGRTNPDGSVGQEYGYDPVMFYLDLYFPHLGKGTDVRVGRYISLPDIEAQLAPNNYTYSHSLTYTYDCYTQTGVNATTRWNEHWKTQAGVSAGCEATPWTKAPDAKLTFNGCLIYEWNEGKDNIYPCLNALNSGKYAYNNLQAVYLTWYHKFTRHPSLHTATEYWYMWQNRVPNVNPAGAPAAAAALVEPNANGAWCKSPQQLTCYAPEHAVLNYVEKQFGKRDYLSIRNEWFDDQRGQRTGFQSHYTEHTIGWGHWIGTTILVRPELRFERSYQVPAYDNGTKKNQLMFASDVIVFF
ncbi:MAG TPA: outer membrane beta-barrel protein [Candidatus Saccharimonadales bacterium]|jgi:hypothetical protein|nr:outer membrane beta-barrel protein [Candidatus Saccharimonadales bacterium]